MLAFGQSELNNKDLYEKYAPTEMGSENHQIRSPLRDIDSKIETTLINDIKQDKSVLDFEADKSYGLSFKTEHIELIDRQITDKVLYRLKPLKDLNWQLKKPIDSNDFFEIIKDIVPINRS